MSNTRKIAVIGMLNMEFITGPLPHLPEWGTQARSPQTQALYSGTTLRVGAPLRVLGDQVSAFAVNAEDDFGRGCLRALQSWGIGVEGVEQMEGERTASCVAIVRDDGERMMISDLGVAPKCDDAYLERHLAQLLQFDLVLLSGLFILTGLTMAGVRNVFHELRKAGVITLLDTGWHLGGWPQTMLEELYLLLRESDYVLPNRDEICKMAGREGEPEALLRALRAKGANNIYLKLGRNGAACLVDDEFCSVEGIAVTPLNTMAAGECFDAGALHGLATGMTTSAVLDFANRLAAHYVATGEYAGLEEL